MARTIRTARVAAGLLLLSVNTLVHVVPLLMVALAKAVLRWRPLRRLLDRVLMAIAESWIGVNAFLLDRLTPLRIHVELPSGLRRDGHYLVLANHQSWVDIPVLQKAFNRRIPLLRFFLKRQLFWVPLLGLAWWALDFPFMRRYTREQVARRPALAGRDLEATRRACERFRDIPVSVMNFPEGSRRTPEKHAAQGSPYRYLLRPRAGGVAFVLGAMGEAIDTVLDVTVAYQGAAPSLSDLLAGDVRRVDVLVRTLPVPPALMSGEVMAGDTAQAAARDWINALWRDKDDRLADLAGRLG
ncbi:MAG: acyltransferase [Xanthomonadales bacterium]|nr:acyltransferase [Xanthomonadales bacterium]